MARRFIIAGAEEELRTTTLIALVIGKVADALGDEKLKESHSGAVKFLSKRWKPDANKVFESEFRSPTWDGPALAPFTWDMVRDAFVIAAALDYDARREQLDPEFASRVQEGVDGILRSEFSGSWLDIPMAREGKQRAFVSNTLHSLRAVLASAAWVSRSVPSGLIATP